MRRHSKITLYGAAILLCVAGILCTVVSDVWAGKSPLAPGSSASSTQTPRPANANPAQSGTTAQPSGVIRADTSVFWVTRYNKCGHEKIRELKPEASVVGKTYPQFALCYPKYQMEIVNGMLCMVNQYDQYCPEHYIIKSDDGGGIFVYRNMEGEDKLSAVMKMTFSADAVPQDYRPLLKDGMVFGSVEEIEGLIEDAET